jgi:NADPH-dependent 2,4-dienoyl-CoA reductase/sulfur reductase-like enzyme/nitrite reductase/ring-hydroxylating ferredoxin subunit
MPQREYDVAALDQIPKGGMQGLEVEGTQILLLREGDTVHAVGAICPHAGGPLIEGVRWGDRLVCPWHKATFCMRTGSVLEPPALDPLPRFDLRILDGRVLLTLPAEKPGVATPSADKRCFVIVGAGAAGAVAAQTLREVGFGGRIVMFDRENRVPYDRTILSKYVLSGEPGAEKSPLQKQSFYAERQIERRTAEITHIDVRARRIQCADGSNIEYDAVLLATGGAPRPSSMSGADLGHVFLLHSRTDAEAILAQAERSERAVIVGGSFIGMEVAASLRQRGLAVTVIAKEEVPFAKRLGVPVGTALMQLHEKHGVAFRLGSEVARLEGGPDVRGVVLQSGECLAADLVVLGLGVAPVTSYAHELPRTADGGIRVDAQLRAADNVYAAGDIACFPYRGDLDPIRVEHWRVAEQQGRVAALNMMGLAVRYEAEPVFWTIQYLKRLDYVGHATGWDDIVIHGDIGKPEFLAYYVKDGIVLAAAGLDRDRDTAALVELLAMRRDWTAEALGASPAVMLGRLAPP